MKDTKDPRSGSGDQNDGSEKLLYEQTDRTESIDLSTLFTKDMTSSGSFDVKGDIWATTFGGLLQALPIPALLIDRSSKIAVVNQACRRISPQYERIQETPFFGLFPNSLAAKKVRAVIQHVFSTRKPQVTEAVIRIGKNAVWGRMTFRSIRIVDERFVLVLVEDLTSEKKQLLLTQKHQQEQEKLNQQLKASLKEKEVLLREIHHRVKNNLAVVGSLLSLQAGYATDDFHRRMFNDIQARIRSMALAHEILYQSENLAELSVPQYVGNLVDHLFASERGIGVPISLAKEIDDLSIGLDTAIPLGCIVTELVSNCLKHAFPQKMEGEITLTLRSIGDRKFELVVRDTGVGMPKDVDLENPKSLGLDLVNTFVEQLRGEMVVNTHHGTETRIEFLEIERRTRQ